MNRLLVFLCGVAVATAATTPLKPRLHQPGNSRVVNGEPAEEGQFPHQVSFQRDDFNGHFCGASILTSNHIVIAAHCIDDLPSENPGAEVVAGSLSWSGDDASAQRVRVASTAYYGQWDPFSLNYDYAVMTLEGDGIDLEGANVATIRLADAGADDPVGMECTASGWGADENGNPPANLMWTTAYPIDDATCQSFNSDSVGECTSCTLDPNGQSGICFGDSGGPLACMDGDEMRLYGIASWGYGSGSSCSTTLPNGWGQATFADAQAFIDENCGGCISNA